MPEDPKPLYHTAYETYAFADLRRAISLDDARHEVQMVRLHDKPLHLTPDQISQRNQILSIAHDILKSQARKYISEAVTHWLAFQKHEKELDD